MKPKGQTGILVLIYSLYFFAPTISAISPAIADIGAAYPTVSSAAIGYVVTVTAILQAVTALVTGFLAQRFVKIKTLLIIASLLYVGAGCFPFMLVDGQLFAVLLVTRGLFGVATGIIMPLSNTLVMLFFSDEVRRAGIVGVGNVLLSLGTIVTSLIGGYLCLISWQAAFLVHALGISMLVFTLLFMRDPDVLANPVSQNAPSTEEAEVPAKKRGDFPISIFGYLLLFVIVLVTTQPMVVYNAQYVVGAGIGDSVTVGYMTTVFSIGGMIASLSFKRIYSWFGKAVLPVSFGIAFAAAALGYIGSTPGDGSIVLYGAGIFCAGISLLLITCYIPVVVSSLVAPRMMGVAMGCISFTTAAGTFLTTPFAQIVSFITGSDGVRDVLLCTAYLSCAACVFVTIGLLVLRMSKGGSRRQVDG